MIVKLNGHKAKLMEKLTNHAKFHAQYCYDKSRYENMEKMVEYEKRNFMQGNRESSKKIKGLQDQHKLLSEKYKNIEDQMQQIQESSAAKDKLIEIYKNDNNQFAEQTNDLKLRICNLEDIERLHERKIADLQQKLTQGFIKSHDFADVSKVLEKSNQDNDPVDPQLSEQIKHTTSELYYYKNKIM